MESVRVMAMISYSLLKYSSKLDFWEAICYKKTISSH